MAQFEIVNGDSLCELLQTLGDRIEEVAPDMLDEAAPILASELRSNFPQVIGNYSSKIKISKAKKAKNGGYISTINFTGTTERSTGNLRNAELMAYWEYGATTTKNEGKGFIRKSVASSSSEIQAKMQEVLEKELTK